MAKVKISDVIVPEVFNPYVLEQSVKLDTLIASGIVSNGIDGLNLSGGGFLFKMPFWLNLRNSGLSAQRLSDNDPLVPRKIGAGKDMARLHMLGDAWSSNDLSKYLAGDDPMKAIATEVAGYWVDQRQNILVQTIKGIFAAASMAVLTHDITALAGGAALIDFASSVDAGQKLGDQKSNVTGYLMHSAVEAKLAKDKAIEYETVEGKTDRVPVYMGKRVIVTDALQPVGGVYTSLLFGEGAFGYQERSLEDDEALETDRDKLAGDDLLISRSHFVMHPRGVAWTETNVPDNDTSPTDAQIADGANWNRVYEPKNIRMVALKHKIAA
ncbi:hypothetical protein SAMN04488056_1038 [Cohaesibacter marisflavi]|uniref:Coat protein n=1 Tax=Cohaesibacter marisflavi TaxID=655353 RepID=A0A1I5E488_9HYPH|nr:major capsid protein [Cohaesibacter marisflavi]SFO05981.1 hypothetical protein SAMN04488056_1038 [Cohaesibacter marisflavi]